MVSVISAQSGRLVATTQSPKPLLRRPTSGTVRKSNDASLESVSEYANTSPRKRPRVTFDLRLNESVMDKFVPEGRTLEAIREEVKRAIEAHMKGDSDGYEALKHVFIQRRKEDKEVAGDSEDGDRKSETKTYLVALTSYASLLNRSCAKLVKTVLAYEWTERDEGFVKAYILFLGSLASAQGAYVELVLGMLVEQFYGANVSGSRAHGTLDTSCNNTASRVHVALKYILQLIPSASSTLSPILSARFPFSDDTRKNHITYIENLTRLIDYAPELKSVVFALITDRLVKIDVQMQVDLDDLDDDVAAAIVQETTLHPFNLDEASGNESDDSDADSAIHGASYDAEGSRVKEVQGNIEKMDAILDLLFAVYTPYFSDPNSLEAASMFETLLGQFSNIILPTYRSRHTQFLLFHFAQTAEHLVDQFAGTCVQLAFQPGQPVVLKQSSASYLASFVARGMHVRPHVVRTVFELIGNNLEHIRIESEPHCRGPDLKRFGIFYAMTQALLYIFCFRWRDLIDSFEVLEEDDPVAFITQDLHWIPGIKENLSRTIYSKLNPLKICSPSIVSEFAKIAHHLRFMYIYPLLETNKRIRLSQFSSTRATDALRETGSGQSNESWHQLDAYFPFDPYQLPRSKRWIEDDYVQWKNIPGLLPSGADDEDGEDESDEDGDEDDIVDEGIGTKGQ